MSLCTKRFVLRLFQLAWLETWIVSRLRRPVLWARNIPRWSIQRFLQCPFCWLEFQAILDQLHPNIRCMRHPDHIGAKGTSLCVKTFASKSLTSFVPQIVLNFGLITRRFVRILVLELLNIDILIWFFYLGCSCRQPVCRHRWSWSLFWTMGYTYSPTCGCSPDWFFQDFVSGSRFQ